MILDQQWLDRRLRGEPGFSGPTGGFVHLPWGIHQVPETLKIGGGTASTARPAVTLQGHGMGNVANDGTIWGATVLEWTGPPGEPVIVADAAPYVAMRDFMVRTDGPQGEASAGIVLTGNNREGGGTQGPKLERVSVCSDRRHVQEAIGVYITGDRYNDQIDRVGIVDCDFSSVGVGVRQDSQQTVNTEIVGTNFSCFHANVEILDGSAEVRSGAMSERYWPDRDASDFVAVRLGRNPHRQHQCAQKVALRGIHWEVHTGTFVEIDAPAEFSRIIEANYFLLQAPGGKEMKVIDSKAAGPLVIRDNTYNSNTGARGLIRHRGGPLLREGGDHHRKWLDGKLRWDVVEGLA